MVQLLYRHGFWVQCGRGFDVIFSVFIYLLLYQVVVCHYRSISRFGNNECAGGTQQ